MTTDQAKDKEAKNESQSRRQRTNERSGPAGRRARRRGAAGGRRSPRASSLGNTAIIAPKADAGFLLMAAKRGFAEKEGLKLELLEVKDDQIGLKALLSGELDSYEGGVQGAIAVNRAWR